MFIIKYLLVLLRFYSKMCLSYKQQNYQNKVAVFLDWPVTLQSLEIIVNPWYFVLRVLVMCPLIGGVPNPVCCIFLSKGKRDKFWHVTLKAWTVSYHQIWESHLWCAFCLDSVTWWIVFLDQSRSLRGIYGLLAFHMFSSL